MIPMTEMERMLSGRLYIAQGDEIAEAMSRSRRLQQRFNTADPLDMQTQMQALKELLGAIGEDSFINQTFRCDYGSNIRIGRNCFFNYDCIIIDVCPVTIGDNVLFGPRVCVYTAAHPIDAEIRGAHLEYGRPVTLGSDVWVGGNAVINPGVTIGDDVVIGAGSVVTKDIPSHVIAVGNPCRVLRPITEADRKYWSDLRGEYRRDMGL